MSQLLAPGSQRQKIWRTAPATSSRRPGTTASTQDRSRQGLIRACPNPTVHPTSVRATCTACLVNKSMHCTRAMPVRFAVVRTVSEMNWFT